MEEKENMPQKNEGGECCSSSSGSLKSLKTAIFVLVIIAACALAAHSVLTNGANSPCGGNSAGLCPLNKSCATGGACVLGKTNTDNTGCITKEKADNPSPCCPGTAIPGGCPNAGVEGGCPKSTVPNTCPNSETPSSCPKAAVPGCCPSASSN